MFTWKELKDGRSLVLDARGAGFTRAWYVAGATPDTAIADPNPSRPFRGQEHPDYAGYVVEVAAYRHWLVGTRVEARYIPSQYLQNPVETGEDPDFIQINPTFVRASVKLPVVELYQQSFRDSVSNPDQLLFRFVDEQSIAPLEYDRLAFDLEVVADIQSTPSASTMLGVMHRLREEIGKIHTIDGVEYEFSVVDAERLSEDSYRFVYRWIHDPGIPNTLAITAQASPNWGFVNGSFAYAFFDDDFIIPPFTRLDFSWEITDGKPDPTKPPIMSARPVRLANPNGWMTLPGITP